MSTVRIVAMSEGFQRRPGVRSTSANGTSIASRVGSARRLRRCRSGGQATLEWESIRRMPESSQTSPSLRCYRWYDVRHPE